MSAKETPRVTTREALIEVLKSKFWDTTRYHLSIWRFDKDTQYQLYNTGGEGRWASSSTLCLITTEVAESVLLPVAGKERHQRSGSWTVHATPGGWLLKIAPEEHAALIQKHEEEKALAARQRELPPGIGYGRWALAYFLNKKIAEAAATITKWKEKLDEGPSYAFEWADSAMKAAATDIEYKRLLNWINREENPPTMDLVYKAVLRQVTSEARRATGTSSSPTTNLMTQFKLEAKAELLDGYALSGAIETEAQEQEVSEEALAAVGLTVEEHKKRFVRGW